MIAATLAPAPATTAWATVARSVAVGTAFGVALRLWMRFVTEAAEFTWTGTAYIVGVFAVLGFTSGMASVARRRGWRRRLLTWRVVGTVLSLGCFVAAGGLMFPTIVPGGLAVARHDWWRWLRIALGAVAVVAAVAVVLTLAELSATRRAVALVAYLPLCMVEIRLVAALYAPPR